MDALGINLGFFIAQVVNFSIFVLVVYFFGWRKLVPILDKRREDIAKGLEDARIASEARANAESEAQKILTDARAQAQKLVADARASAEERAKPIIQAAEADAEKIRTKANTDADELRNSALSGVRGQVVNLAMAAANKLIGEAMDKKQQEKLVNDFFTKSASEVKNLGDNLVVTTALPLSDDEKKSVEKSLGGSVASWNVDPNILGGLVVRAGDRVVDGSIRSSMGSLSASLN
jgi:F-type H+-transporting ATPase subunit b